MFKYTLLIFIGIILSMGVGLHSQTPDAHYGFSSCSLSDSTSSYMDALAGVGGAPGCTCGVKEDCLIFENGESIEFPDLDLAFDSDFALSFYFWPKDEGQVMDIFSISSDSCSFDSVFSIKYLPSLNQIKVDIIERGSRRISLTGQLKDNHCWHYLVINNKGPQYDLYLDNRREDSKEAIAQLKFKPKARVKFSGSPCIGASVAPYKGLIDEFNVWEQSLHEEQIKNINLYPDKIITEDKTVFLGDQVQIKTGGTCSNNFTWRPTEDIQNLGSIDPLVIPTETRTYILEIDYPTCSLTDTINIYVLDREQLDCKKLLLPNAFTPNNDGVNETFGISNGFIVDDLISFDIYDKWANTIFHTVNKDDTWDGSFLNKKLNPGLYVYKLSYTCKQSNYNKTGSFTLLR